MQKKTEDNPEWLTVTAAAVCKCRISSVAAVACCFLHGKPMACLLCRDCGPWHVCIHDVQKTKSALLALHLRIKRLSRNIQGYISPGWRLGPGHIACGRHILDHWATCYTHFPVSYARTHTHTHARANVRAQGCCCSSIPIICTRSASPRSFQDLSGVVNVHQNDF